MERRGYCRPCQATLAPGAPPIHQPGGSHVRTTWTEIYNCGTEGCSSKVAACLHCPYMHPAGNRADFWATVRRCQERVPRPIIEQHQAIVSAQSYKIDPPPLRCEAKMPGGPTCHQPGGEFRGTRVSKIGSSWLYPGESINTFECGHPNCKVIVSSCPECLRMHAAPRVATFFETAERCRKAYASKFKYQYGNSILRHAVGCQGKCGGKGCASMKVSTPRSHTPTFWASAPHPPAQRALAHFDECNAKEQGGCKLCQNISVLLQVHALTCENSECEVPRCRQKWLVTGEVRRWMKEIKAQRERWRVRTKEVEEAFYEGWQPSWETIMGEEARTWKEQAEQAKQETQNALRQQEVEDALREAERKIGAASQKHMEKVKAKAHTQQLETERAALEEALKRDVRAWEQEQEQYAKATRAAEARCEAADTPTTGPAAEEKEAPTADDPVYIGDFTTNDQHERVFFATENLVPTEYLFRDLSSGAAPTEEEAPPRVYTAGTGAGYRR
mmetsp:Transcript_36742/g.98568  ORF Transcript_36742/g.98568 Transcript_36742/m.98568 type:complete len:502 (+) Transcript_36742:160-1665(+)